MLRLIIMCTVMSIFFVLLFNSYHWLNSESEAIDEFGRLLKLFCGTHSYHNFISMKGRELRDKWKEVRMYMT